MKIIDVEAIVLESPYKNRPPQGSEEAHGVKHCLLLKVTTDEGISGWSDVELMIDPGWMVNRSARDAIELIRALEPFHVFWVEDFLHPECYDGYARVKEANLKTRLAAGEQEATAWGFHDLITRGKVDVVQPDLSRCGGLSQARKIVWEAQRAGFDVCPHAWLTDLLSAASLHLNACLERSLFLEYNVCDNPMLREIIRNPAQMDRDGFMPVPQTPGLGIEVDEKAVQRFRVEEL